jgi:hypothetical protein
MKSKADDVRRVEEGKTCIRTEDTGEGKQEKLLTINH